VHPVSVMVGLWCGGGHCWCRPRHAPDGRGNWEVLLCARAIETQTYVFAPAQWGRYGSGRHSYGHTLIADPWGHVIAKAQDRSATSPPASTSTRSSACAPACPAPPTGCCRSRFLCGHLRLSNCLARDKPRRVLSTWPETAQRWVSSLCEMLGEGGLQLVRRNEIHSIGGGNVVGAHSGSIMISGNECIPGRSCWRSPWRVRRRETLI
jgi:Carbon-nitrogen hydrolase